MAEPPFLVTAIIAVWRFCLSYYLTLRDLLKYTTVIREYTRRRVILFHVVALLYVISIHRCWNVSGKSYGMLVKLKKRIKKLGSIDV
jgi:hypothetical protein